MNTLYSLFLISLMVFGGTIIFDCAFPHDRVINELVIWVAVTTLAISLVAILFSLLPLPLQLILSSVLLYSCLPGSRSKTF